ncbi:pepsin/retropepsin-like aspartic protease family protein [Allorhizobium taibaishanense]|uniref:Peptidase A2 domain-containing protein n=1 Tax=Allorhizobium taibaishanense TaxID=887144 RepID=A0A1Q8ZZ21_9HYPH|nr:hypothetical protein [Allorhizobium taibaishanense]MBB4007591.1 hypothetical protein [Allorhizobium taibaishanense]OLP47478.1 hypothetical protein BJF91_03420 [Allorhizobium taibaishanense]
MRHKALVFLLLLSGSSIVDVSEATAGERMVVPIHALERHDIVRYWIPVKIGAKTVEALLDTGSTGLHVMGSTVSNQDYAPTGQQMRYSYSNGQTILGDVADAQVSFGDAAETKTIPVDVIRDLTCNQTVKRCLMPLQKRLEDPGQLLGKENYQAIIGASMPSPSLKATAPNPLVSFGDAWIINLPRSAQTEGQLIINPTADDLSGFVRFPAAEGPNEGGGRDNPIHGCLTIEKSHKPYCGPFVLDNGNPKVLVIAPEPFHDWRPGTRATISFGDDSTPALKASFSVGSDMTDSSRLAVGPFPNFHQPPTRVLVGVEAYKHFSVLYDYKNSQIGLKRL